MIFNMLKFHSHFIAKKMFAWSILLQNGTSVFPGSFYIDVYWACHFRSANFKEFEGILRNFKEY